MLARDIMTRPVVTFWPETSVRQAAAVLTQKQITAAPVLDKDDELIGMVSEADLIADRFPHDPRTHARRDLGAPDGPQTVGEVMTRTVIAMSGFADAADIAEAMLEHDIRSLPIVEGASVVGIVSRRDLLRTLVRDDDMIGAEIIQRLRAYTGERTPWDVTVTDGRVQIYGDVDDQAEAGVVQILARTVPGVTDVQLQVQEPTYR
jgi:CBS domain-containing protein